MSRPEVIVCAGGGGVGKTTTSAAFALALAKNGYRALIVSIDPARRLADAMGVELGTRARRLSLDAGSGQLYGLMPDPQSAMRTFIEILFEEEPGAIDRLLENRLYRTLEAAVPGIHEIATMSLTWRAIIEHQVDAVVIDTAPSRNAVDFISYPKRLAKLLGGRAVGWMAAIGKRTSVAPQSDKMGRVEQLLVRALGPVARDVAGLFAEMARVRKRFILFNEHTSELLLHPDTRYFLVASPTAAASEDVDYLIKKLSTLGMTPKALILNSAFVPEHDWIEVLENADVTTPLVRGLLAVLREEKEIRERAAARLSSSFARRHPELRQLPLPFIEVVEPRSIVNALSEYFDIKELLAVPRP
jgi:anion-transporting  ArsA/GET3 family ATPase